VFLIITGEAARALAEACGGGPAGRAGGMGVQRRRARAGCRWAQRAVVRMSVQTRSHRGFSQSALVIAARVRIDSDQTGQVV